MKRDKTQTPETDATVNPTTQQQTPVDSRQNDGGEGVIVTRGGAEVGNAARKNAEDAANANDSPASGDPHR